MIKKLLEKFQQWRENRHFTVPCPECKKDFNAQKQSGLCPHIPIKEFIYGIDKASGDGDYTAEVKGYKTVDGTIIITDSKTWKNK
jgi:hypothetical protein